MWMILIILIFSSASFYFATSKNKRFEEILPITTMSIIALLYVLGLIEKLKWAIVIIYILTGLFYFFGILSMIKKKNYRETLENMITPAYSMFLMLFFIICYFNHDKLYGMWDDFSHWGTAVKTMYHLNALSTDVRSNLVFASYPPATTLFEYFFMKVYGSYSEGVAMIGYNMLAINILLGFAKKLNWESLKEIYVWLIVIVGLPVSLFDWHYSSLVVDSVLGIVFGCAIALIFLKEKWDKINSIQIILLMSTLCLIKDSGLHLAIVTALYMIVDFIISNKGFIRKKKYKNKDKTKWIGVIVLAILMIVVTKFTWRHKVEMSGVNIQFQEEISIKETIKALTGKSQYEYRNKVAKNYIFTVLDIKIKKDNMFFVYYTPIFVCVVFLIYVTYIRIDKNKNNKKRYLSMYITIFFGMITYIFGLLLLYLFRFSENEALQFASYYRYVGTYFYGIFTIVLLICLRREGLFEKNRKKNLFGKIITVLILSLLTFFGVKNLETIFFNGNLEGMKQSKFKNELREDLDSRLEIKEKANLIKQKIEEYGKGKTYVICQEIKTEAVKPYNSYIYWILRQELWPNFINGNSYVNFNKTKIGRAYHTYKKEPLDFIEELKDYKYIYVYHIDKDFFSDYGEIFKNIKNKDNVLYIIEENNGKTTLKET